MSYCSSRRRFAPYVLIIPVLVGCGEVESVRTTEEPRGKSTQKVGVEEVRNSLDHMLAAMIPQGDQAWFIKLVAPGDQIESLRGPFEQLIASFRIGAGDQRPSWTLPEGWLETPGDKMRAATIEVPAGDAKLPLTISSLPLSGEWQPYVERNVNRWMGQLQQSPLPAATIEQLARQAPIASGGSATVIELTGVMEQASMSGPLPPGHPPVDAGDAMPAGTDAGGQASSSGPAAPADAAAAAGADPGAQAPFSYELPAGWQPGGAKPMRVATFVAGDDAAPAELAVTTFPANAMMSDPTEQAKRWAGQIGLRLDEAQIEAAKSSVTIDGIDGQQYLLAGDDAGSQATLAAMIRRGDAMWFFKMTAQREAIESHRGSFAQLLQSIKFKE